MEIPYTIEIEDQWMENNGDHHSQKSAVCAHIQWNQDHVIQEHYNHCEEDTNVSIPTNIRKSKKDTIIKANK